MIRIRWTTLVSVVGVLLWAAPAASQTESDAAMQCGALPAIDAYVDAYRQMAAFDGVVLIARGDRIVYRCGYGMADYHFDLPMSTSARFRIGSLSKHFTVMGIGLLVDRGLVETGAPLARYLPDFPRGDRITIQQLIDHTAGIVHTNEAGWMEMGTAMSLPEIVQHLAEEPLRFEPGTDEEYSNGGYALLAAVIEAVSGRSFDRFVSEEFGALGMPSVGHEDAWEVVDDQVSRYAPGPEPGRRVEAPTYLVANRIGGGSLYASADDVLRTFRGSYSGDFLSPETTAALFPVPRTGETLVTGRSSGTLAQVYLDFREDLTVVTLSSSSGWPGSFNPDIVELFRGGDPGLAPFEIDDGWSEAESAPYTGTFEMPMFGWTVELTGSSDGLIFAQGEDRTALRPTTAGEFHLPLYDWLCAFAPSGASFTCRQRDPDAEIRFVFERTRG